MIAAIKRYKGKEEGQHSFKKYRKDCLIILKYCTFNKLIFVNFDVQGHLQF